MAENSILGLKSRNWSFSEGLGISVEVLLDRESGQIKAGVKLVKRLA